MKLLFVVNPISGGIDKEPFLTDAKAFCKKYAITYKVFKTSGSQDEEGLKIVLDTFKPDRVASVGGDGTTLFTAIVLQNTNLPMGIIPLGSANGMATELNVNSKPIEALKDLIISEVIGDLDMVLVNDTYHSIHIGDVGINAKIVEAYEKDKNRGMVTYAKYFLEEIQNIEPFAITIEANDKHIEEEGVMLGISNSRKYGTGVPLNAEGNPMDGKFELVVVRKIDANLLLKAGLSKFDDRFYDGENQFILSTDSAKISFETPRMLQLDGEIIGKFKSLKVDILKGAVKLITHHDNMYIKRK
ncbi:diacylglycerol/lipid kinase family protein [Formosa haliotis]|uniref:diacylglycerol/lipid kinase family protein n=1 Tax=Formosa haliotis TaxID=1555194 RepID=UPI000824DC96|nr:diacylglycerol kinase family protein [Formosa haliotis]